MMEKRKKETLTAAGATVSSQVLSVVRLQEISSFLKIFYVVQLSI